MKQAGNAKRAHSDLQCALESMLKVLKNLNDSLHVVGLKGFPVSWCERERGEGERECTCAIHLFPSPGVSG